MSEPGKSQAGGSLKYIIGGLLLLGAAVGIFMLSTRTPPAPEKPAPAPAPPPSAERVNPMAEPELILDDTPDAAAPVEAATEKPKKPAATEARDSWDCDGDIAVAAFRSVVDANRAQVRACYERRLKVNNVLQGELKLKLKVGANGQTSATQVSGSLKDSEVISCVKALAQKWSFPPPTNGKCAVAQVPFNFAPKN